MVFCMLSLGMCYSPNREKMPVYSSPESRKAKAAKQKIKQFIVDANAFAGSQNSSPVSLA